MPEQTLRCIFCQRTITWPMTSPYPRACPHCGRMSAHIAERVTPAASTLSTQEDA